jgi:phosphoenolpyruvate synthase/pyruvate phosphate dikinase
VHSTAPSVPLWCSLVQSDQLGVAVVGSRVKKLTELAQLSQDLFLLPETFVLTRQFFTEIFVFNDLEKKFYDLFRLIPWENAGAIQAQSEIAQEYILHAQIPDHIVNELTLQLGRKLENNYFAIRPSFTSDVDNDQHLSDLHVRGMANVMESVLRVWSRAYIPTELRKRVSEFQSGQLVPIAMILQRMINATSSGFIEMTPEHSYTGAKIHSVWGVMKRGIEHSDSFEVDLSQQRLIGKEIVLKLEKYSHHLDTLQLKKVEKELQDQPSLTEKQVQKLIEIILRFHKKFIFPQKIEWSIEADQIYILSMYQKKAQKTFPEAASKKHDLELFLITSRTNDISVSPPHVKGIVFNADHVIRHLDQHPEAQLSKASNAQLLKDTLTNALISFHHAFPFHQFVYRASHTDSGVLAKMKQGAQFETREENPTLGFRGGLRVQRRPQIFDLELDVLTDFHKQTQQKIAVTLPWIRTPGELQWLKKHIFDPYFGSSPFLETWLECSTPENILNIEKYLNVGIHGIVIDVDTVHALLHGIDPHNKDISNLYSIDYSLLQLLLAPLVQSARSAHVPVFVLVRQWQKEWGELAQSIQATGLVVQEKDIEICLPFNQS